nr:MAG TPA: hypothetical protein [Inoviridae sp.]
MRPKERSLFYSLWGGTITRSPSFRKFFYSSTTIVSTILIFVPLTLFSGF